MTTARKTRKLLIAGIIGCLLYVVGDFLFAATGKGQTTETIGLFTKVAYLEMAQWRMWASILCGFVGTLLYYMGFHRMYGLLKRHVTEPKKPNLGQAVSCGIHHGNRGMGLGSRDVYDKRADLQACFRDLRRDADRG